MTWHDFRRVKELCRAREKAWKGCGALAMAVLLAEIQGLIGKSKTTRSKAWERYIRHDKWSFNRWRYADRRVAELCVLWHELAGQLEHEMKIPATVAGTREERGGTTNEQPEARVEV